jgi:hypothetical protein
MTGYQVKEHKHRSNFIQHDRYQNMTGYQFKEYKHRVNFIQHDRYQNMTGYQTRFRLDNSGFPYPVGSTATQSSPDRRACKITFLFSFQTINFELLES